MTNEEIQKDEQYMRRALDEARQALEEGEIPIGAVVSFKAFDTDLVHFFSSFCSIISIFNLRVNNPTLTTS